MALCHVARQPPCGIPDVPTLNAMDHLVRDQLRSRPVRPLGLGPSTTITSPRQNARMVRRSPGLAPTICSMVYSSCRNTRHSRKIHAHGLEFLREAGRVEPRYSMDGREPAWPRDPLQQLREWNGPDPMRNDGGLPRPAGARQPLRERPRLAQDGCLSLSPRIEMFERRAQLHALVRRHACVRWFAGGREVGSVPGTAVVVFAHTPHRSLARRLSPGTPALYRWSVRSVCSTSLVIASSNCIMTATTTVRGEET